MKKTLFAMFILAAFLLVNPITADACQNCSKKAKDTCKISKLVEKAKMIIKAQDCLKLSDEQVNKIKDIKHKAVKNLIQQNADIDIIKVDVKSAMWKEMIDLKEVNKLIDSKYSAKNKAAKTYVKALHDIQSVLTPEQRGKALKICAAGGCAQAGCQKCAGKSSGKFCPITGKPFDAMKGSSKGSMK